MNESDIKEIISKYEGIAKQRALTVEDIFAGSRQLTETVGARIKTCYEAIELAISALDTSDPDLGQKKHDLQQLKQFVPKKFGVTKEETLILNEALNNIVGVNRSENKG